ncbi:MAG: PqqD family protein [Armatimonadetes bacterium]|nr:PqqD family protein [Armatimonadota bacterium]
MKVKDGFLLREIAGEHIVVPIGERVVDLNGLLTLNATARVLWEELATEQTEDDLVEALTERFEVSPEVARTDVSDFIGLLAEKGLLDAGA